MWKQPTFLVDNNTNWEWGLLHHSNQLSSRTSHHSKGKETLREVARKSLWRKQPTSLVKEHHNWGCRLFPNSNTHPQQSMPSEFLYWICKNKCGIHVRQIHYRLPTGKTWRHQVQTQKTKVQKEQNTWVTTASTWTDNILSRPMAFSWADSPFLLTHRAWSSGIWVSSGSLSWPEVDQEEGRRIPKAPKVKKIGPGTWRQFTLEFG